jgi:eukaryotic-like serine/threonine-protein kinase
MAVGPGTILQGRYHIVELLDSGGMGQVWRGQDAWLNRAVAIKVMQDHYSDQESFERFVREARVAAGLDHPGITAVYDFGRHDNQYFIVMQLLKGQDLKAILKEHPMGLPVRQAVSYAIQAAEALAAAHETGVIHRDLKPANLFIVAGERLKICDFGIAKHVDATRTLTRPGEMIGTPAYMSPEQWSGRPVDARSDLYSLGCVLYELLVGRPPFAPEQSVHALWAKHLQVPPAPPQNGTYLPSALSDFVLRMLAKDAGDRPQTAASLAVELRDIDLVPPSHTDRRRSVSEQVPRPMPSFTPFQPPGDQGSRAASVSEQSAIVFHKPVASKPMASDGSSQLMARAEAVQRLWPWTIVARVSGWLLFLTMLAVTVGVAFGLESLPWLWALVPGTVLTAFIALGSMGFGFDRGGKAAWALALLWTAEGVSIAVVTGNLVPAAGIPITGICLFSTFGIIASCPDENGKLL